MCALVHVSRASYYDWASGRKCGREVTNLQIAGMIEHIHDEDPSKGYRRIADDLRKTHKVKISDSRVHRICSAINVKSTIKYGIKGCTRHEKSPWRTAENILNREFHADAPNQKWLTDVTEFKWHEGPVIHKLYLSAILDLYDRRIVAYSISDHNDNGLVFTTFDRAVKNNPGAHPLFHSDRGYQYTSKPFCVKLQRYGMQQSMSRVGRCIDNGPMEGFWGILKRERYYGRKFTDRLELIKMIVNYISYYNNRRLQRNLGVLTPMEKHNLFMQAA